MDMTEKTELEVAGAGAMQDGSKEGEELEKPRESTIKEGATQELNKRNARPAVHDTTT